MEKLAEDLAKIVLGIIKVIAVFIGILIVLSLYFVFSERSRHARGAKEAKLICDMAEVNLDFDEFQQKVAGNGINKKPFNKESESYRYRYVYAVSPYVEIEPVVCDISIDSDRKILKSEVYQADP